MIRHLTLALLLLAPIALAESVIVPVGTTGLDKADFALVLYECTSDGCVVADSSALTVTEQANARDYLIEELPDTEAGDGTWYELTMAPDGLPARYAWPIQTRTPQSTSSVVSYRVPATMVISAGDTLPAVEVSVAGLTADPSGASVLFDLWAVSGTKVLDGVASDLVDSDAQADGTWTATFRHSWLAAETEDLSGSYYGRFRVTFSGGGTMTIPPAPNSLQVRVYP